jgi:hypothetical protein
MPHMRRPMYLRPDCYDIECIFSDSIKIVVENPYPSIPFILCKIFLNPAVRYAILNMEGAIAHKVVDLPDEVYIINLPRPVKYKAGLFISACYSYLCRQAMQRETNRPKTTGLKLRRYSYASPPLFFKFGEAFHLVTQSLRIL